MYAGLQRGKSSTSLVYGPKSYFRLLGAMGFHCIDKQLIGLRFVQTCKVILDTDFGCGFKFFF